MTTKFYDKVKTFIKENIVFIIIFALTVFLCLYKLPYYIDYPGGLLNTNERVSVKDSYKSKGSFNMTYVNEVPATIPLYLLSKVLKNWDVVSEKEVLYGDLSYEEIVEYGKISMRESNKDAIKIAYTKAGKTYIESNVKTVVLLRYPESDTDLKVGDIIETANGKKITDFDSLTSIIKKSKVGDRMTFEVFHGTKKYKRYAKLINVDGETKIGILLRETRDINAEPLCELKYTSKESGASGGLMTTLTIYNNLIEKDLTLGMKIAGTGTIERDGTVGEIGGVKYKVAGAVKEKAKIFFVPAGENYEEALKTKKANKYKIEIVPVETFDDAVDYLENYKK